ncbi:MAG: hypothetical protein ACFNUE_00935 [Bacteroides sp.]
MIDLKICRFIVWIVGTTLLNVWAGRNGMRLEANLKICLNDAARRIATVFDECKWLIKLVLSYERKRTSLHLAHMRNLLQERSPDAKNAKNGAQLSICIHPSMR